MKRDMDLVRQILIKVSEKEAGLPATAFVTDEWSEELVSYNIVIMEEAGLIELWRLYPELSDDPYLMVDAKRLTWEGNELLSLIKSEDVWQKVKNEIAKTGQTDAPLEVFKTIAIKTLTELMS